MKILEITEFSAGVCGVWTRVLAESKEFVKLGHQVTVFSSDIEKGTHKVVAEKEETTPEGIKIVRFKSEQGKLDKYLSKNVSYFNFDKAFEEMVKNNQVNAVITHLIHPHSFKALKLCQKAKMPCYLVTHAPFNVKRRFPLNILTSAYYHAPILGVKSKLARFTKIIRITHWEKQYLDLLGVPDENMVYIPNGIPDVFFQQKILPSKIKGDVLFLGRVAPVKDLKTLIIAAKKLPEVKFSCVGSVEEVYMHELEGFMLQEGIKNVTFYPPVYDLAQKIALIDQHPLFVLPSVRDAMPQVLLEAMARGRIVISSETDGGKEILQDNKTGFLFPIGDANALVDIIKKQKKGNKKVQEEARIAAQQYAWSRLIKKYTFIQNHD